MLPRQVLHQRHSAPPRWRGAAVVTPLGACCATRSGRACRSRLRSGRHRPKPGTKDRRGSRTCIPARLRWSSSTPRRCRGRPPGNGSRGRSRCCPCRWELVVKFKQKVPNAFRVGSLRLRSGRLEGRQTTALRAQRTCRTNQFQESLVSARRRARRSARPWQQRRPRRELG